MTDRRRRTILLGAVTVLLAACGATTPSASWQVGPTLGPEASAPPASAAAPTPITAPATPAPPAESDFTLMDFNIEYGGDEVDFDKVVEAIRLADPDVVALEEAEGNTAKVAEALGWPYHSVRSQLVSKLPLIDPPGADGVYEYVEIRPGEVVAIANVHLPSDPYGPYLVRDGEPLETVLQTERDTRLAWLQPKLDGVAPVIAAGIPTFVVGDFNAPSHLDWTTEMVGVLPQIKEPIDWPVSEAMAAAGFRDAYREVYPDPVTSPGLTWWAGRPLVDGYPDHKDPQDRIDQIHVNGRAAATAARIVGEVGGPQVDIAVDPWGSDHRAVVADFRLTPGVPEAFVAVDSHRVTSGDDVAIRYRTSGASGERLAIAPADAASSTPLATIDLPAGETDGVVTRSSVGWPTGDLEVQLLAADGTITSRTPLHVAAPDAKPSITLAADTVKTGEPIDVRFTGTPGSRWDWFGLYPRGGDPATDDYLYYAYTGSRVSGTTTIDEAGEGDWPIPPGEYDLLLLLDDGYTELARVPLTITE